MWTDQKLTNCNGTWYTVGWSLHRNLKRSLSYLTAGSAGHVGHPMSSAIHLTPLWICVQQGLVTSSRNRWTWQSWCSMAKQLALEQLGEMVFDAMTGWFSSLQRPGWQTKASREWWLWSNLRCTQTAQTVTVVTFAEYEATMEYCDTGLHKEKQLTALLVLMGVWLVEAFHHVVCRLNCEKLQNWEMDTVSKYWSYCIQRLSDMWTMVQREQGGPSTVPTARQPDTVDALKCIRLQLSKSHIPSSWRNFGVSWSFKV
jgi:hypothetical protein